MYQHLVDYYWGYFELLKYFQRPGPSSGGATITELDTNEVLNNNGGIHDCSATSLLLHNTRSPGVIKTIWVGQNEHKNICFQSESDTWKGPDLKTELHARPYLRKSTHPRNFSNHMTVRPKDRPSRPQENQCRITQLTGITPQVTRGVFGGKWHGCRDS